MILFVCFVLTCSPDNGMTFSPVRFFELIHHENNSVVRRIAAPGAAA
jgi:hypothetical protein